MNKILISYELPMHISTQQAQLISTVKEIEQLLRNKALEFESEEKAVDFVELNNDQFEHQTAYLEDKEEILNGITQTLYSSLFISIYSHLETNFSSLIKEIETKSNRKIKSKHLKRDGSFINCCLNYLTLVQNLELSSFSKTIGYLNDITYVRNVFTHSRGILPEEESKMKKAVLRFIKDNSGIELNNKCVVITNEKFIENVINKTNEFLLKLIIFINKSSNDNN